MNQDYLLDDAQDEGLLPEEFVQQSHPPIDSPEHALQRAVLHNAIAMYRCYALSQRPKTRAIADEAREWFLSEDLSYIYSYEYICSSLGINPGYLRRGILASDPTALSLVGVRNQRSLRKFRGIQC